MNDSGCTYHRLGECCAMGGDGQIEQDLIISRAIIDIFGDDYLREELRFRGGTALNKLHFPEALRYSEDIDLVRTSHGPIRDILDGIRRALDWLGEATFKQSQISPKLIYKIDPEHEGPRLKLKVEINTRETEAFDGSHEIEYAIENPWFSGGISIPTFTPEEMLATKLRALLQRNKGRDLFDLSQAMSVLDSVDLTRTVELFRKYLEQNEQEISRANAEERMWAKLENPGFLSDIRPLLSADAATELTDKATMEAYSRVFTEVIALFPGKPWALTPEMADKFGVQIDSNS
jgi:predicted nucleotidyltransferase component of viral defense system